MSHWGKVTPGLCGINDKIPRSAIKRQWDKLIIPAKQDEPAIFERVFELMPFLYNKGYNQATGLDYLYLTLENDGIIVASDGKEVVRAIFEEYWTIAPKEEYWQNGHYMEWRGHITFDQAVAIWENANHDRIFRCERDLNKWLHES